MNHGVSRFGRALLAVSLVISLQASAAITASDVAEEVLQPEPRHEKIGQLVRDFIERSHYSHASVDDELSAQVLENYIEALDGNRMYLLESDVETFRKFRHQLDDMVDHEPLNPVFNMFDVYRTRARERIEFALSQLETEPDFAIDEEYTFDRSESPWARTRAELDEIYLDVLTPAMVRIGASSGSTR